MLRKCSSKSVNDFLKYYVTQEATGGKGPDIIIEMLASVNIEKDLQIINTSGTIAVSSSGWVTSIFRRVQICPRIKPI